MIECQTSSASFVFGNRLSKLVALLQDEKLTWTGMLSCQRTGVSGEQQKPDSCYESHGLVLIRASARENVLADLSCEPAPPINYLYPKPIADLGVPFFLTKILLSAIVFLSSVTQSISF